ncbi:MAG: hypothetical protein LBE35_03615 [Clostridiales bacterium]|nr:hypothetical protein [Clostridiales bacterium]
MENNVKLPDIPEPFRGFLAQGRIEAMSAPPAAVQMDEGEANHGDLLFLAAILMLCDD